MAPNSNKLKLAVGAMITDALRLKLKYAEQVKRSHTGTFVINFHGQATDLYRPEIFPHNTEVKCFRFLRKATAKARILQKYTFLPELAM